MAKAKYSEIAKHGQNNKATDDLKKAHEEEKTKKAAFDKATKTFKDAMAVYEKALKEAKDGKLKT